MESYWDGVLNFKSIPNHEIYKEQRAKYIRYI